MSEKDVFRRELEIPTMFFVPQMFASLATDFKIEASVWLAPYIAVLIAPSQKALA